MNAERVMKSRRDIRMSIAVPVSVGSSPLDSPACPRSRRFRHTLLVTGQSLTIRYCRGFFEISTIADFYGKMARGNPGNPGSGGASRTGLNWPLNAADLLTETERRRSRTFCNS